MADLSLCMIVKNEEETLARCLDSIYAIIDELIIVDTGSTDSTKQIASAYNAKIYDFEWIDDFAAARNFAFSKATSNYIIWLDADDIVKLEDQIKLIKLKNELDGSISQIAALYNVAFDEFGNVTMSYYRERIFKNNSSFVWVGEVHECIPFATDVMYADFAITHSKLTLAPKGRNLRIYDKIKQKRTLDPREQYYYARELYYNDNIEKARYEFEDFLKSDGWAINKVDACVFLCKCYLKRNDSQSAKKSLFNSFLYGEPTAEICCEIGRLFMEDLHYKLAIYWYTLALSRVPDIKNGSFISNDAHTFLPCIQLCVCYDRIGDIVTSQKYNEYAATFKPNSKAVELNRKYFANMRS